MKMTAMPPLLMPSAAGGAKGPLLQLPCPHQGQMPHQVKPLLDIMLNIMPSVSFVCGNQAMQTALTNAVYTCGALAHPGFAYRALVSHNRCAVLYRSGFCLLYTIQLC